MGTPFNSKLGFKKFLVGHQEPPDWLWVVARGPHQAVVRPRQVEESWELKPCQPSAQSSEQGGKEAMANLYTKCF